MKVALDVDDVICAFFQAACEWCGVELTKMHHWEQDFIAENWDAIEADENFWENLDKLNDVDFDFHCYITSLPEQHLQKRIEWLNRHGFPQRPVYVGKDKVKIAEELGVNVLIDDKPDNIIKFIESGRHAIHYIPPYTTIKPVSPYYTYDFGSIKTILNQLKKEYYEEKVRGIQGVQTRR